MQSIAGIALLGCGTVGGGLAERLLHERNDIERRSGIRYELRGIAVRDPFKDRGLRVPRDLFTRDAAGLVDDPQVDVVVECIGGTTIAAELIERALDRGRHVVTANKDLIATQGPRLRALAARRGTSLHYEAAVAGAIPVVRALDESLASERIGSIAGIVNGTCNAILSSIENGLSYQDALADAQRRGYAEANPSSDVQGTDSAHKLAILVQLAFGIAVISPRIRRTGIVGVNAQDVAAAARFDHRIKLVAAAVRTTDGCRAEVAPVWVPNEHPFARISGATNAVRVVADDAGELFFSGQGAGRDPSASAVLADIVATLRRAGARLETQARVHLAPVLEPAVDVKPVYDRFERAARFESLFEAIAAERALRRFGVSSANAATITATPVVRYRPDATHDDTAVHAYLSDAGLLPISVYPIWEDRSLRVTETPDLAEVLT